MLYMHLYNIESGHEREIYHTLVTLTTFTNHEINSYIPTPSVYMDKGTNITKLILKIVN